MSLSYYAVSIQGDRLFAIQVEPDEVAVLLDAGHLVQLARPVDLVRVAVRHNTMLTVFTRDDVLRSHGHEDPHPRGHRRSQHHHAPAGPNRQRADCGRRRVPIAPTVTQGFVSTFPTGKTQA